MGVDLEDEKARALCSLSNEGSVRLVADMLDVAHEQGLDFHSAVVAIASSFTFHAFQLLLAASQGDVNLATAAHAKGFVEMVEMLTEPGGRSIN